MDCNFPPYFVGDEWVAVLQEVRSLGYVPISDGILRRSSSRVVLKAKGPQGAEVVLKFINRKREMGFIHEWDLPGLLELPHTLRPLDHFISSSYGIIVFPFVSDARPGQSRTTHTWLRILKQLFETLVVLHENGYAHLDIKPSNILLRDLRDKIQVTLIDFGLVEFVRCEPSDDWSEGSEEETVDEGTETKEENAQSSGVGSSGTWPYIDPVYIETNLPSVYCDMWSVGIMLAQTIFQRGAFSTLFPPLSERSSDSILAQAKAIPEKFQKLLLQNPSLVIEQKKELVEIAKNLLVLDQKQRWSSHTALQKICEMLKELSIKFR